MGQREMGQLLREINSMVSRTEGDKQARKTGGQRTKLEVVSDRERLPLGCYVDAMEFVCECSTEGDGLGSPGEKEQGG
ncbi:hypothetical protein ACJRO7_021893, partial [Eucalyptus globulus]